MKRVLVIVLLLYCAVSVLGTRKYLESFETDYINSRAELNALSKCKDKKFINKCSIKCNGKFRCVLGKCFCYFQVQLPDDHELEPPTQSKTQNVNLNPKFKNLVIVMDTFDKKDAVEDLRNLPDHHVVLRESQETSSEYQAPALRHHIAHFCPNLDIARQCIRKCMNLGKPAFCGKDHVCYCGHKYDDHHKDPKVNPSDMYAQFRDLYAKYFGPIDDNDGGIKAS